MTTTLRLQVSDLEDGITRVLEQIRAYAAGHGVPADIQRELHLVVDEIVTNVIRYGYGAEGGTVDIGIRVEDGVIELEIVDRARPFNPLAVPDPDITIPPEHRKVGGLGLYFVRQLMTAVEYSREGEENRLLIRRGFPISPGDSG